MLKATAKAGGRSSYWFTCKSFIEPTWDPSGPDFLPNAVSHKVWFAPTFTEYQAIIDALTAR